MGEIHGLKHRSRPCVHSSQYGGKQPVEQQGERLYIYVKLEVMAHEVQTQRKVRLSAAAPFRKGPQGDCHVVA